MTRHPAVEWLIDPPDEDRGIAPPSSIPTRGALLTTCGLEGEGAPPAAAPDALLGREVAGKFLIEKRLRTGAMGVVYRAQHTALQKVVAIKVMHAETARDPMFAARFHREAQAASRLEHPNSIQILDYGQDADGLLYIAMEYLDGLDLGQLLFQEFPLSTPRIIDLLSQALGAIARAHDIGIVHRDLKPENIMVLRRHADDGTEVEVVKVCDFGIAKISEPDVGVQPGRGKLTTAGLVIGTPAYMSPEQGRGEAVDGRSDVYSMGVILYDLLTGQLPFEASSPVGLVVKHQKDAPVPPSLRRSGVDPRLEAVCLKALEKAPQDRYQTVRDLRAALQSQLDAAPPSFPTAASVDGMAHTDSTSEVTYTATREVAGTPTGVARINARTPRSGRARRLAAVGTLAAGILVAPVTWQHQSSGAPASQAVESAAAPSPISSGLRAEPARDSTVVRGLAGC